MNFSDLLKKSPFESNAANTQLAVSTVTGVALMYVLYKKISEADSQGKVPMSGKVVAGSILLVLTALSIYISAYHIECVMYGKCNTFAWVLVALSVFNIFSMYTDINNKFALQK